MKKKIPRLLIATILISAFSKSFAGGFQVNLQGQKQTGMAHCGVGIISDASGIFFNPGTVCFVTKSSLIAGASFVFHHTTYREEYPGTYTTSTQKTIGTPFTFYANIKTKEKSKFSFGLGIYTPFGSRIKYDDDWKGNFLLQEIDLKAFFFQPTLSYKINDKIGIGAGFVYANGSVLLRKALPVQDLNGEYGEGTLNGKANGFGYNIGFFYKVNEKFSLGLSYRSRVNMKVENGDATFVVPSSLEKYFPSTTFNAELPLPWVANVGVGYKPNKKLLLVLDFNYVGWKSYDTLSFDFKDNTEKLEDIHSPRMFKNSSTIRFGAQYQLNEKFYLRGGAYYDFTPVQNGYLSPETPDAKKFAITCGASFKLNKHFNIDASLLYTITQERTDTNIETQFSGTWKSAALAPGISIEYIF